MVCHSARISPARLWSGSHHRHLRFCPLLSCRELWVYTDATDTIAAKFYTGLGFEALGPAVESAPGRTMDDSDIVMKRML